MVVANGIDAKLGKMRRHFLCVRMFGKVGTKGEVDTQQAESLSFAVGEVSIDDPDVPTGAGRAIR